jgi:osmotically-inducible protein OsmY
MNRILKTRGWLTAVAAVVAASQLSACAPLVLGSAVGGAFVATDRRTSGAQLEDQGIEIKAANRLKEALGDRAHVNVNAYNRLALLTGEVGNEADRQLAERTVAGVENVQKVVNELGIMGASSLTARANDVLIETKVKATLVDARDVHSNAFRVVVERGEVYLQGMVTEREGQRAAELAASVSGVQRVVKVFHLISEEELARKTPKGPEQPADRGNYR